VADWTAFGAVVITVTALVLLLARATQSALERKPQSPPESGSPGDVEAGPESAESRSLLESLSTEALYLNVAGTQALFLLGLVAAIWYTEVPLRSLGVVAPTASELGLGTVLGVTLFVLNQAGARLGRRFGLGGDEALREALAPETVSGWAALLFGLLPLVAGFEELLFRGALIGGLAAGFGIPVRLLVAGSSVAFALGHGMQGRVGVVVTGLLGIALASAFVATGSLTVVIVAHYLVNALEFVVWEGIRG